MYSRKRDSGQIALILVLIMTVIGGAAVALSGRTTVETRVQQINIDSSQAQIAAESGLAQALKNSPNAALQGSLDSVTTFSVGHNPLSGNQVLYKSLSRGSTIEIFIAGYQGTVNGINFYWSPTGNDSSFTSRGLFITKVEQGNKLTDYGFCSTASCTNGFTPQSGSANGFSYSTGNIAFSPVTTTEFKVTALGGDIDLGFGVSGGGSLTAQLVDKPTTGTVIRGSEKIQYSFDYRQSVNKEVPEIFDYALFSGGSISQ